jgi:hypothetical protein
MPTTDLADLRNQILTAIRELAGPDATHAPTYRSFLDNTSFTLSRVRTAFGCYANAVEALGLKVAHSNKLPTREELLQDFGETVRRTGATPIQKEFTKQRRHAVGTIRKLFGGWRAIPAAFRTFAAAKPEWTDVLAILDHEAREGVSPSIHQAILVQRADGAAGDPPTCGEQIDFRALRHAPINELGVVFLFGMLSGELGFTVDIVRAGFPDCEALRPAGDGKWQRVRIEFEFESRSFSLHGHDPSGCDVIVCWRHNWIDCPPHLEVLELQQLARMGRG